jgi:GNAT superfamily N-acetyltransferase
MDGRMKQRYENEHASCEVVKNPELPPEMDRVRELVRVWTDPEHRKQGYATELVQAVCDDADANNVVLILQPRPFGHIQGLKTLEGWYRRFGFIRTQDNPVLMARAPSFRPRVTGIAQAVGGVVRG